MLCPIDLRPTRLNSILQDLFRDTPLDHIWRAEICAKNAYLANWPYYLISVAESDLVHMMSPLELPAILKHRDESKDQNQVSTRIHMVLLVRQHSSLSTRQRENFCFPSCSLYGGSSLFAC